MAKYTMTLRGSYRIFDVWSEVLAGTHYLLTQVSATDSTVPKVERGFLCRLVLVSSHQLVEIALYDTIKRFIDQNRDTIHPEVTRRVESQLGRASLHRAIRDWPWLLLRDASVLDFSREPMQSQEALRIRRNKVVHTMSESASVQLASAGYYTGIAVSRHIHATFFPDRPFQYEGFVDAFPPLTEELLSAVVTGETA